MSEVPTHPSVQLVVELGDSRVGYRLHEAAERIAAGAVEDFADLAIELGYADQAHFIRDFKRLVGRSPAEYARSL